MNSLSECEKVTRKSFEQLGFEVLSTSASFADGKRDIIKVDVHVKSPPYVELTVYVKDKELA
jgi:hypothetical protein